MIALLSLAFADPGALDAAYQREYAYLQAEASALKAQREALVVQRTQKVAEAEAALARAQAEVLALTTRHQRAEDVLAEAQRGIDAASEGLDRVEGALVQASASLPDTKLPEGNDPVSQAAALALALQTANTQLREAQGITRTQGSWFAEDGSKQTGEIVRIGRIAAIATGHGALAPAGEGRLVRVEGKGTYLFEGEAKRALPEVGKTWEDQLRAGGIVGAVILVLGGIGVLLMLGRVLSLGFASRGRRAMPRLLTQLQQQGIQPALDAARNQPGAAARVFTAVLDGNPGSREDRAAEAILLETPAIERFGTAILVIAAVSPLLGLLGTVTGMIGTFEVLTTFGTGDPRMLSAGISEALVTTQLGLIVAIPTLLLGNLLNRAADQLLGRLESTALGAMNRCEGPSFAPDPQQRLAAK